MTYWLKLIGLSKKPITGPPYNGLYAEELIGFHPSKVGKPSIKRGDHLFLYATGSMKIFALAEAVGDLEFAADYIPGKTGSCQWNISIRYEWEPVRVESGIPINRITSNRRNGLASSVQQKSHIRLNPEEIQSAYRELENISTGVPLNSE